LRTSCRNGKAKIVNHLSTSKTEWAILVFCLATAIAVPAQTVTTLANFDGTNGSGPRASLVQGIDGNLYGTTGYGGAGCGESSQPCGTVFNIDPLGTLTTLHDFCAFGCAGGTYPYAELVQGTDGNFYGTTELGGNTANCPDSGDGCGTVFRVSPDGTLKILYSFCAQTNCPDGSGPVGGLVQGADGNFYGTTTNGPTRKTGGPCGSFGCGTVFKITPSGELTTLYRFCAQTDCPDGAEPEASMVQGTDGSFYGTTAFGGGHITGGAGTVFKITPSGELTTLYRFCAQTNCADGFVPNGLVQGTDGNFYGTTFLGTVFRITPGGTLTTLHTFAATTPTGQLVEATDGNFYGVTNAGGNISNCVAGCGTVFKIAPAGTATTLYNFCSQTNCADGVNPWGGLVQDTNGDIYGTTFAGGSQNVCALSSPGCGTVFRMDVGLGPFVSFVRGLGHVGVSVQILGQGFTGATAVSFNGIPASFTVKSDTYLTATVPSGAANGSVTVTEPSGTLTSNKIFRVVPWISSFSPTTGPAGTTVVITGTSFTGATVLSFTCGKKATFTVDSDTQITATVPEGALSGPINVVTPDGHWGSIPHFTVTP
jgi:uncharacterized repeat protein (TIGR03803 family)